MEKESNSKLYAVYGTLRKGYGNHRILDNEHCEYLGTQRTTPEFKMVTLGGFPGVIPDGSSSVTIEVYRVNHPTVDQRLDWLEGYPSFYQKTQVETEWGTADMYILSESGYGRHTVIPSGDWAEHVGKRTNSR